MNPNPLKNCVLTIIVREIAVHKRQRLVVDLEVLALLHQLPLVDCSVPQHQLLHLVPPLRPLVALEVLLDHLHLPLLLAAVRLGHLHRHHLVHQLQHHLELQRLPQVLLDLVQSHLPQVDCLELHHLHLLGGSLVRLLLPQVAVCLVRLLHQLLLLVPPHRLLVFLALLPLVAVCSVRPLLLHLPLAEVLLVALPVLAVLLLPPSALLHQPVACLVLQHLLQLLVHQHLAVYLALLLRRLDRVSLEQNPQALVYLVHLHLHQHLVLHPHPPSLARQRRHHRCQLLLQSELSCHLRRMRF